VTAQIIRRYSK